MRFLAFAFLLATMAVIVSASVAKPVTDPTPAPGVLEPGTGTGDGQS